LITTRYEHLEALASTHWLAAHLNDPSVRVVDMRFYVRRITDGSFRAVTGREAYAQGHIPGAVFVDQAADLAEPGARVPLEILGPERFESLMGRLGIATDSTVVVYDDSGGTWAARLWWALRYYGHAGVKLLDGGLTKWVREGRPLETRTPEPRAATFHAHVQPALRCTRDEVRQAIGRADTCIIDALPETFYTGEEALFPNHRTGHIPTAVNVPAPANLDPATLTLRSADELARLWREAGLKPDQAAITYCGTGAYAAYDFFVLHVLGHNRISLYDASWMEWGADPDLPVQTGTAEENPVSND
jgi:thiosulfate/3-mercaptopyruvate sulfurtransferase